MQESAPAINPFAAPTFVTEQTLSEVAEGNRASELVLHRLCQRLTIADISFTAGCISFFATYFWLAVMPLSFSNTGIASLLSYLPFAFFTVTWIYLYNIHRVAQGWIGAIGVLITFPIPVLGTLIFRKESTHANVFLFQNGYQRTFFGGKPDPVERQRMKADPNYVPSIYFDIRGHRRPRIRFFTLGDACFLAMIGFILMSMVMV